VIYIIAALLLCLVLGHAESRFLLYAFLWVCVQVLAWVILLAVALGAMAWLYTV
jgi:hypothetical protein